MHGILITGSNRGLGLEAARQYAQAGWRVYATCRHPAEANDLQALAHEHPNLSVHRLDVSSQDDNRSIHWEFEATPIDVLLSNAGLYLEKGAPRLGAIRYDDWRRTFEVNTLGHIRVIEALLESIERSQRRLVAVMSSHMGSIADIQRPGSYYYRSSKAALNAVMQGLAVELKPRGIGVLLLHPGAVNTRMGPRNGGLPPSESIAGIRRLIDDFHLEDSGRFLQYDGQKLHW